MIKRLDAVALTQHLPALTLYQGQVSTLVEVYKLTVGVNYLPSPSETLLVSAFLENEGP